MSVVRRQGIKNTVYMYLGILLGIISTLYMQPFFLSKEQIGITRLIISIGSILASVSCLGITSVIIRFFPLFHNPITKHRGFFTVAVVLPVAGFVICLSIFLLIKPLVIKFYGENGSIIQAYFWPIMLIAFSNALVFSFSAYCNSINKSSLPTFINEIINRILFITCILLFFYGLFTQTEYIYSIAVIYVLQLILLYLIIRHFDHPHLNLSFFSGNTHLKDIFVFSLISAFIQITAVSIKFIDVLFVGKYQSIEKVGIYSIAAFIGLVLETPLNALERIASPKIARLFVAHNYSEIIKIYRLSSKYLMVFCGFLGCILVSCIQPLLALLPGDYSAGTNVTIIICIGAFFNAATGVNYSIVTFSNLYKTGALFYFLLLLLTVTLNILLIPIYGIMGAALASALISIAHNLLRFLLIKVKLNMQPFHIDTAKVVLIIALTLLPAFLIQLGNNYALILVRGIVCACIFPILLIILNVFSLKEMKQEIKNLRKFS